MACTYEPKDPKSNPLGVSKKMSKEELAAIIADKWKELDITIDKKAKYSAAISTHRYKSKFKPFLGSKNEALSLDGANQNEVNAIALDLVKDAIKHGTLELLIADTRDSSVMSGLLKIAIAVNAYGEYAGEILEALQKNDTKTLEKYKYITEAVKDYAKQAGSELGMFRTVYSDPMGEFAKILEDYDAIFEPVNETKDTTETKAQKKNISSISKKVKEGLTDVDIDIDKVVKDVTPSSPQKRKSVKVEEAKLALKDVFAAAKAKRDAANKGTLSASIIGLTDADIEYIGTIIKESIKFGIKHPKALIQMVIDNYDDQILSDEAKEYIRADIENQIAESKYNDNVTRLKNKIANLRTKIENVGKPTPPTTKKEGTKPNLSNEELELIKTIDELKEVYKAEQKRVNNEDSTQKRIELAKAKLEERKNLLEKLKAGVDIDITEKETKKKVLSAEETEIKKKIDEVNEKIKEVEKSNTKTDSLIKAKEKLQKELKIATNGKTEVDDSISESKAEKQKLTDYQKELVVEIDEIKSEIRDRKQENALEKQLQKQLDILNDRAIEELKKSSKKLTNKSIEIKKDIENVKKLIKEKKDEAKAKKENSLEHYIKEEAKKLAKSFDIKNVANDDVLKDFVKRVAKLYRQKNVSTAPNVNTLDTKEAYLDYLEEQDSQKADKIEDYVADFKAGLNDSSESIQGSIVDQAVDEIMANEKLTDQQKQDALVTIYDKFGAIYKNNIPDKAILDFIKLKLTIPLSQVAKMDNPSIKSQLDDLREELSLYFDGADYTNMMDQVEDRLYAEIQNQGIKNLKEQLKRENINKFGTSKIKRSKIKFAEQKLVDLIWQGALNDSSLNNLVASALGHDVLDQESREELLKEALLLREYNSDWANRAKQRFTRNVKIIKNKAKIKSGEAKWYQRKQDLNTISGLMQMAMTNILSGNNTSILTLGATYLNAVNQRFEIDYINKGLNIRGTDLDKKNLLTTLGRAINIPNRLLAYTLAHKRTIGSLITNYKMIKDMSMQALKGGFVEFEGDIEANRDSNFFDRVMTRENPLQMENIKDPFKAALFIASILPTIYARINILADIAAHATTREFYLNYEMNKKLLGLDEESAESETIDLLAKAYNDIDINAAQEVATAEYKALKEGYDIPHKDFLDIFEKVMENLPEGEDPMEAIREEILNRGGYNKSKSKTTLNDTVKKRISELNKSTYSDALKQAMSEYNEYNEKGVPVVKSTAYARAMSIQGEILNAEAEVDAARKRTRNDTEQNDPIGSLGRAYDAFEGIRKIGGFPSLLTLFMRSGFNAANRGLDYAGYGIIRGVAGKSIIGTTKDAKGKDVKTQYTQEQRLSSINRALTGAMIAAISLYIGSDDEGEEEGLIKEFFNKNLSITASGNKWRSGTKVGTLFGDDYKPSKKDSMGNITLSTLEESTNMITIKLGPFEFEVRPGMLSTGLLLTSIGEAKDFETYKKEMNKPLSKAEFLKIAATTYIMTVLDQATGGFFEGASVHTLPGKLGNVVGNFNPLNAAIYKDAVKTYKVLKNQGKDEPAIKIGESDSEFAMKKFWLGMSNNTIYGMSNNQGYDLLGQTILINPKSLPFNGGFGVLSWMADRKANIEKSEFKNIYKYQSEGKANFEQTKNLTAPDQFLSKSEKKELLLTKEVSSVMDKYDKDLRNEYAKALVKSEDVWMNIKSKEERQDYIDRVWKNTKESFDKNNKTTTLINDVVEIEVNKQLEAAKSDLLDAKIKQQIK